MARISNFFDGTNFVASNTTLTVDWKVQLSQDGGSRDTRLVYHNGSLYLGTGLGSGTASQIRVSASMTRTVIWTPAGQGMVCYHCLKRVSRGMTHWR
jgi:hypothetical protein